MPPANKPRSLTKSEIERLDTLTARQGLLSERTSASPSLRAIEGEIFQLLEESRCVIAAIRRKLSAMKARGTPIAPDLLGLPEGPENELLNMVMVRLIADWRGGRLRHWTQSYIHNCVETCLESRRREHRFADGEEESVEDERASTPDERIDISAARDRLEERLKGHQNERRRRILHEIIRQGGDNLKGVVSVLNEDNRPGKAYSYRQVSGVMDLLRGELAGLSADRELTAEEIVKIGRFKAVLERRNERTKQVIDHIKRGYAGSQADLDRLASDLGDFRDRLEGRVTSADEDVAWPVGGDVREVFNTILKDLSSEPKAGKRPPIHDMLTQLIEDLDRESEYVDLILLSNRLIPESEIKSALNKGKPPGARTFTLAPIQRVVAELRGHLSLRAPIDREENREAEEIPEPDRQREVFILKARDYQKGLNNLAQRIVGVMLEEPMTVEPGEIMARLRKRPDGKAWAGGPGRAAEAEAQAAEDAQFAAQVAECVDGFKAALGLVAGGEEQFLRGRSDATAIGETASTLNDLADLLRLYRDGKADAEILRLKKWSESHLALNAHDLASVHRVLAERVEACLRHGSFYESLRGIGEAEFCNLASTLESSDKAPAIAIVRRLLLAITSGAPEERAASKEEPTQDDVEPAAALSDAGEGLFDRARMALVEQRRTLGMRRCQDGEDSAGPAVVGLTGADAPKDGPGDHLAVLTDPSGDEGLLRLADEELDEVFKSASELLGEMRRRVAATRLHQVARRGVPGGPSMEAPTVIFEELADAFDPTQVRVDPGGENTYWRQIFALLAEMAGMVPPRGADEQASAGSPVDKAPSGDSFEEAIAAIRGGLDATGRRAGSIPAEEDLKDRMHLLRCYIADKDHATIRGPEELDWSPSRLNLNAQDVSLGYREMARRANERRTQKRFYKSLRKLTTAKLEILLRKQRDWSDETLTAARKLHEKARRDVRVEGAEALAPIPFEDLASHFDPRDPLSRANPQELHVRWREILSLITTMQSARTASAAPRRIWNEHLRKEKWLRERIGELVDSAAEGEWPPAKRRLAARLLGLANEGASYDTLLEPSAVEGNGVPSLILDLWKAWKAGGVTRSWKNRQPAPKRSSPPPDGPFQGDII